MRIMLTNSLVSVVSTFTRVLSYNYILNIYIRWCFHNFFFSLKFFTCFKIFWNCNIFYDLVLLTSVIILARKLLICWLTVIWLIYFLSNKCDLIYFLTPSIFLNESLTQSGVWSISTQFLLKHVVTSLCWSSS